MLPTSMFPAVCAEINSSDVLNSTSRTSTPLGMYSGMIQVAAWCDDLIVPKRRVPLARDGRGRARVAPSASMAAPPSTLRRDTVPPVLCSSPSVMRLPSSVVDSRDTRHHLVREHPQD